MKMSGSKGFLDTNIVIDIFSGKNNIVEQAEKLSEVYINSIVLGELYIGINRVANRTKHLKKLNDFLQLCTVLDVDAGTSEIFGSIVAELHKKGKPIPTNDVWIAASARQHNLLLITNDKHFKHVIDLPLEHWK